MNYGLDIPIANEYSEPKVLIDITQKTEKAGWDGFFFGIYSFTERSLRNP